MKYHMLADKEPPDAIGACAPDDQELSSQGKVMYLLKVGKRTHARVAYGHFANHGCDPGFTTRRQGRPVMGAMLDWQN